MPASKREKVLAGTVHVQTDDAEIKSAFGGYTESEAREAVGDKAVESWGDHVWAKPENDDK